MRILYIEDDDKNRLLVERVLLAEGYEIRTAANAKDGILMAINDPPDLILMDINMPEMDGYAATGRLRQEPHLSHVPIIALTANVMKGDMEQSLAAGCDGYISKPIDIDKLPEQIQYYLR